MTFNLQYGNLGDHRKSGVNPIEIFRELSGLCSSDSLTLTMPFVPASSYSLRVRDPATGYFPGKMEVVFSLSLDIVSPTLIGQSGGQPITLSGAGFSAEYSAVTVDGIDCLVQTVNAEGTQLTCIFEDLCHICLLYTSPSPRDS